MHFVVVPVFESEGAEADLNRFLASHRVLSVERELLSAGPRSAWAVCINYVEGQAPSVAEQNRKKSVDYREVLSPEHFADYAQLRALRKELAEKQGVPAYSLFTNEQLAAIVRNGVTTLAGLKKVEASARCRGPRAGSVLTLQVRLAVESCKRAPRQPWR